MMLCEKCGQREATTHLKQMINGNTTILNLCPDCAEQMGLNSLFHGFHFNIGDLFGELLGNISPAAILSPERKICSGCQSDLKNIIDTGKIGCPRCYTTFREELLPTVEKLHGKVHHEGKLPHSAGEAARKKAQLNQLRKKLEEAIRAQAFEKAAEYRDQINELEQKEGGEK